MKFKIEYLGVVPPENTFQKNLLENGYDHVIVGVGSDPVDAFNDALGDLIQKVDRLPEFIQEQMEIELDNQLEEKGIAYDVNSPDGLHYVGVGYTP